MSHVICHVLGVMCHMSCVTSHVSNILIYLFILFFYGQIGEAYCLRVFYQGGLPLLVEVAKIKNMTFLLRAIFFFKIFKL